MSDSAGFTGAFAGVQDDNYTAWRDDQGIWTVDGKTVTEDEMRCAYDGIVDSLPWSLNGN